MGYPIIPIHVEAPDERGPTGSRANPAQVGIIKRVTRILRGIVPLNVPIDVLSFYTLQNNELRELAVPGTNVGCHTVASFQGGETGIAVLGTTRTATAEVADTLIEAFKFA